jgi:hypothetical protein
MERVWEQQREADRQAYQLLVEDWQRTARTYQQQAMEAQYREYLSRQELAIMRERDQWPAPKDVLVRPLQPLRRHSQRRWYFGFAVTGQMATGALSPRPEVQGQ